MLWLDCKHPQASLMKYNAVRCLDLAPCKAAVGEFLAGHGLLGQLSADDLQATAWYLQAAAVLLSASIIYRAPSSHQEMEAASRAREEQPHGLPNSTIDALTP